ncbi:MAG TPA: histidine kinase [Pseudonocardiaceae bacterium]|nr:histidine kinase [Pseudonocardiaceae bacterium]
MVDSPEALLARILDGVPQPVWVVDEAGLIVFANPAAVTALGYAGLDELRGRPSHETVHYRHPNGTPFPADECLMLRPRSTGETVHSDDDWFVRQDGSMFPIAWWSAPIDMPRGRGAVLAFTDTTQRRAAEQAVRERDAAEIRAAELRAAQRRILDGATAARRQLARDLHDGAQQHLVNLLLTVQLAREELATDPARAAAVLADAADQARAAIGELRELSAGIHPGILTSRGLFAAVESLASRAALPARVTGAVPCRLPEAIEASAYFVVAEALTNAVKHSRATEVVIDLTIEGSTLRAIVRDDGVGGAGVSGAGSGLTGSADRLGALGGTLTIDSPTGGGTVLCASFPLG